MAQYKPLTVGDVVPAVEMKNIIHYSKSSASTADYRGKLLLLDFWASWCSNCIAEWPKLDSLQHEFAGKVQIMLVNNEAGGREKLDAFFARKTNKTAFAYRLPSVIEDTVLRTLFAHRSMPHAAWIDGNGKVIAISDGRYISRENIQLALEGKLLLPLKKDSLNLDFSKPLLMNGNGALDDYFLCRSVICPFINGIPAAVSRRKDKNGNVVKITVTNNNVLNLYKTAYEKETGRYMSNANIDIKLKDTTAYTIPGTFNEQQRWKFDNLWCYEIIVPEGSDAVKAYSMMKSDLDHFFHLSSRVEKRKQPCLVLRRSAKLSSLPQKKIPVTDDAFATHLASLANRINMLKSMPIVIDELNGDYGSNPVLTADIKDTVVLQKELLQYGIELSREEREVNVLVIRNASFTKQN